MCTYFFQSGNNSKDYEEIVYKRDHPLIWRDELINNGTNIDSTNGCRNSVQGKTLLVDDEGYVCARNKLLSNGCCDANENVVQYSCDTCNTEDGCCAIYENCVSCCLNPNKVNSHKRRDFHKNCKMRKFLTFFRFFYSDRLWKKLWNQRQEDKRPYLPQLKINLNYAWPNVAPIHIRFSMKISIRIQKTNFATLTSKRTNHSVIIDQNTKLKQKMRALKNQCFTLSIDEFQYIFSIF